MAIAYRNGSTAGNDSGGNLSVNKPTGTADGDILIAVLYREAGTWTLPDGWVQIGSDQRDSGNNMYLTVAWKRASSEGASWTFNLSTTSWRIIAVGAFSGCLTSGDPYEANTGNNGTSNDVVAASITTTVADTMRVVGMGNYSGSDITANTSGMTQGPQLGGCETWYVAQAATGASGTKTFSSGATNRWATIHLALKPDTGAPSPLAVNVSDSTTVSETVNVFTDQLHREASDSTTVTDAPALLLANHALSVADSVTTTDAPTVSVPTGDLPALSIQIGRRDLIVEVI